MNRINMFADFAKYYTFDKPIILPYDEFSFYPPKKKSWRERYGKL
jgi:hypothetical protein